ncbi:SAM domain (Sterile alpha motif) [Phytophthora infestans]|uniref:SAM domain (Sterile alpha motif) n=1 Tax=Phytophthora infestans TaxID=4787 RepID=A0A833W193_PHYIN|nr:SAM domain (Sterile alpha motif) [Phytophthora infestans]
MDWEANLAAIIKCTDASLAQQFREFEDVTAEFTAVDEAPAACDPSSDNVAVNYLRDTMATEYRHRQKQEKQHAQPQTPSYSRVSGAFAAASAAPGTTFSEHFHRRQERKRGASVAGRPRDNQRAHTRASEYEPTDDEERVQDQHRYATLRGGAHQQMYSSPTYDVAQMMEQVRLSLKLEVDARAAIAERQLSALLQLCKATSEELDRLRVEVCANDRQLHTLDQVQSKIRQELTTQKDIGFHLQSMCGKDESWRMQTENQLLELRQMTAALREQGNSTQAVAQEKLSRSELLVQFNAAMEPIKAQLQANLQHQAQQIAEITRSTSSSSLLLDGLSQKVNRGITEELNELRSDLHALKHHVAKLDIFQDSGSRSSQPSKDEIDAKAKEKQQQEGKKWDVLREELTKELMTLVHDYVETHTKPIRQSIDETQQRFVARNEMENLRCTLDEACRNRCATTVMQFESQLKAAQDQMRGECNAAVRDSSDRAERAIQHTANTMTTTFDGQVTSLQSKQLEFVKMLDNEQKERKQALDELHESLRKSRHQLEDQLHTLGQENRTTLSKQESGIEKRLKDLEKLIESAVADVQRETQASVASLKSSVLMQGSSNTEVEQKLKRLEETVSSTDLSVAALTKSIAATTVSPATNSDSNAKDVSVALEKQTNVYVATMESLFQKMQLQLQAQTQPQVQVMAPSPYHGYWPPSPYAANQAPPPPLLHLPPTITRSGAVAATEQSQKVEEDLGRKASSLEVATSGDTSAERVRSALPVEPAELSSMTSAPPTESLVRSSPPPAVPTSSTSPVPDLSEQQSPEPNHKRENEGTKREDGLAATAKGALAEAELAKARVEDRRKETKQQLPPVPVPSQMNTGIGSSVSEAKANHQRFSSALTAHTPALTRSASSSALPGRDTLSHPKVQTLGSKVMTPASLPTTPVGSRTPMVPSNTPPQSTTRTGAVPAAPGQTLSSGNDFKNDSKATLTIPTPSSTLTLEVGATGPEPTQSTLSLSQSTPRQNTTQDLQVPISSLSTKDEPPPSLSPLAKIFGRSTPVGTASTEDERAPAQAVMSATTSTTMSPMQVPVKDPSLPATPAPVSHVLCGLCRLPIRSDFKIEHERSQCPKRTVECASCKQQLQWVNLEIHELECSAAQRRATEPPGTVQPLSDTVTELEGSLKKCRHCSADVPSLDLLEHEINCDKVLKQCPHCLRRQKMSELQEHIESCDCRLVSCPNDCGGKFLQRGIPNHLATRCPKKSSNTSAPVASPASRSTIAEASKPIPSPSASPASAPTGKVECKFCDDEIDASRIQDHEQNCDWKPKRCQHCNMVVISRDLMRHESSCKTNMKSCSHCNENMPQSALTTHAGRCSKRPIKCIRCCQLFPADAIVAHSTNCKVVLGAPPAASNPSPAARAPIKIPPPPPFPPPPSATTPTLTSQQNTRRVTADPRVTGPALSETTKAREDSSADRMARRKLALSQLTSPGPTHNIGILNQPGQNTGTRASAPSPTTTLRPTIQADVEGNEDEEDDEEDDDEDDDQLTLAQVVKEWNVENVCLWLHEDVGVPEVVLRFQQKQCDGEMLLELTESDLINDFGINDRIQRERILSAIEAINTSNAFSDEEDEEDDDEDDEDEVEESEDHTSHLRRSSGGAYSHPRDILQRRSQPSPHQMFGGQLPSSNDMFRRISNALENPKR